MGLDFSSAPDGSAHLRQHRLGLGQPEGHVHDTIHLDSRGQRRAGLGSLAHRGIQCAQAKVAVGLEWAHAELFGQGEGLVVMGGGCVDVRGSAMRGDLTEEAEGIRLGALLLVLTGERQRVLGEGMRLLQTASHQMRLP